MSFQNCDLIQKTRYISAFVVKFFFLLSLYTVWRFVYFKDTLYTLLESFLHNAQFGGP